MSRRDEFSPKTRRAVAARAGWQCSFADCSKLTVGPSAEAPGAITTIGEAAHICAASPGGRRYDPAMTPEERAGLDNAMWVCPDHAKLIDRDAVTYPANRLHGMKRAHEERCARAVRLGSSGGLNSGLLAIGPDIVCTGTLTGVSAGTWTLRLKHFLIGEFQLRHRRVSPSDSRHQRTPRHDPATTDGPPRHPVRNEKAHSRKLTGCRVERAGMK